MRLLVLATLVVLAGCSGSLKNADRSDGSTGAVVATGGEHTAGTGGATLGEAGARVLSATGGMRTATGGTGGAPGGGTESTGTGSTSSTGGEATGGDLTTGGTPPAGGTETGGEAAGGAGGEQVRICSPGFKECQDTTARECATDGLSWLETDCPYSCVAGACSGECVPGTTECSEEGNVLSCDHLGLWVQHQSCPFVCADGACSGSCVPGATQCSVEGDVETCSEDGEWVYEETCPFVCVEGACAGSCEEGTTQCAAGQVLQTCVGNAWGDTETCSFVCTEGACGGECTSGDQDCQNDVPRSCNAQGLWVAGSECPFVCVEGACTGSCEPGTKKCDGLVPQTCNAQGHWVDGTACTSVCSAGECTGSCTPGSTRCASDGRTAQICNSSGTWATDQECPYVCSGAGTCTGSCVPGSTRCGTAEGTLQTCSASGSWGTAVACPTNSGAVTTCSNGACQDTACDAGYGNCDGVASNGCEEDLYDDPENCGSCDHSCLGGSCADGYCGHIAAVNGRSAGITSNIAFDDEGTLYWGEQDEVWTWQGGSANSSELLKTEPAVVQWLVADGNGDVCWSAKNNGIRCASDLSSYVVTGSDVGSRPIAADATNVYWVDLSYTLHKQPRSGGAPSTVDGASDADYIASSGSSVYWLDSDEGTIFRAPVSGGSPTQYVDTDPGSKQIVVTGNTLIWAELTSDAWILRRANLATGATSDLYTFETPTGPTGLGVDKTAVYWVDGTTLYRRALAAGPAVAVTIHVTSRQNLATDDQYVYWVNEYDRIMRVRKD